MMHDKKSAVASLNGKKIMKQGTLFSFFTKKDKTTEDKAPPEPSRSSFVDNCSGASSNKDVSNETVELQAKPNIDSRAARVKIGDSIEVYWAEDDAWYQAKVLKMKKQNPMHYIEYFIDGQSEWIDLSLESFRYLDSNAASNHTSHKRRLLSDDADEVDFGEEAEFVMPPSDDEDEVSVYKDEGIEEEDDEDDQWMVTDDEDEIVPVSNKKRKIGPEVGKAIELKTKEARCNKGTSSSSTPNLRGFAAGRGPITVSQHSVAGKTPPWSAHDSSGKTMATPQQITPGTTASTAHLSSNSVICANSTIDSSSSGVATPLAPQRTSSLFQDATTTSKTPMFEVGALNPAGSHVHNHLPFLQNPRDSAGRSPVDPNYDPRTLHIVERDWIRITGKSMTDAVKQWWDLKAMYFDSVLLFKTGTSFLQRYYWICFFLTLGTILPFYRTWFQR